MQIQVTGDHPAAQTLKDFLKCLGYEVVEDVANTAAAFAVRIERGIGLAMEGLRGPLSEEALHAITELAASPLEWRKAVAGSERAIHIIADRVHTDAIGRGVLRALLRVTGHGTPVDQTSKGGLLSKLSSLWPR